MARRRYRNASPQSTLTGGVNASATALVVVAVTGWPVVFPFTAVVDYGLSTVEVVLVTNVAGQTLTVTRGYDTTTAVSHTAGATVQPMATAIDFDEASAHINASAGVHGLTGSVVGTSDSQTLSSKTLASPVLTGTTTAAAITASGAVSAASVAASGAATAASVTATGAVQGATVAATGNATVGGTLGVTGLATASGGVATTTLSTSGLATLASATVTGAAALSTFTATSGTVTATASSGNDVTNKTFVDAKVLAYGTGSEAGQGWTNVTYTSGWQAFDASTFFGLRYRKIGSIVYVQGVCKRSSTTSGVGADIFVLPSGFRPADRQLIFEAPSGTDGSVPRRIDVTVAGLVSDALGGTTTAMLISLNFCFPVT